MAGTPFPSDSSRLYKIIREFNDESANLLPQHLDSYQQRQSLLRKAESIVAELTPPAVKALTQFQSLYLNLCIRTLIELGVFQLLVGSERALSVEEIAKRTGAEEQLLVRFMRAAAVLGFVTETGVRCYEANGVTRVVATKSLVAGLSFNFDCATGPKSLLLQFVDHFRTNGYKTPVSTTDAPYQHAYDCVGMSMFDHFKADPAKLLKYNTFMEGVQAGRLKWIDWFPVEDKFLRDNGAGLSLVDVAGGHGQDLKYFHAKFPHISGKFVLQDLPSVIDEIEDDFDGVIVKQKHDFFDEQPVKGAEIYFMHMILHDWPDQECRQILSRLRDAMTPEQSRILINDQILPEKDASILAVSLDITMMLYHSGQERSTDQWKDLINSVEELEIVKFWEGPGFSEGIVEVKRRLA